LRFVHRALAPLRAQAREVGPPSLEDLPLCITDRALARALATAARGMVAEPPVEVGGVLIGSLGWCPKSRECYALEVREPQQTQ
jgi:hypothetical protein